MSQDVLKELHKKINKIKGKKEDKKLLHEKLEDNKDDSEGVKVFEKILDDLIESGKAFVAPTEEQVEEFKEKMDEQ